ncbi:ketopantoate reductase family protein [Marinivivus vitaminiproducens]|uniref:ketopantoate reductase family protein n=1 Tax=Marinivivus vitaminiproducens TaxID=3035935 RepID=UPI0027A59F4D|nr:2-dehydropantoate 2-reductase [Geminicoccaceae bacterium SCSIO 64248]
MRICIFGAGAVGGYLAARLAHAGRDVSLVARGAHLDAIRRDGLALETLSERFTVRPKASADPAELGPQDVVIVSTKTTALPDIAPRLAPLLGPDTPVVFAVNGVFWFYADGMADPAPDASRVDPGGVLHRAIGVERAMGMVIYSPNTVTAPGHVHNTGKANRFVLGEARGGLSDRLTALTEALSADGYGMTATDEIRLEMWRKLTRNVPSTLLCGLTGTPTADIYIRPELRALADRVIAETKRVAAAHGFAELGIDDVADRAHSAGLRHKPSSLQDLERGRPVEIDNQLAIIQDFARQSGTPTPDLDVLLGLLVVRAKAMGSYTGGL